MAERRTQPPWFAPGWRAEAEAWFLGQLRQRGITPTDAVQNPRTRFWSIALTVDTDAGRFWFKQNCVDQSFEARLVHALAGLVGGRVLAVTAVDEARGWLLSPDQGATVWDSADVTDPEVWRRLLTDYGGLQRELLDRRADVAGLGLSTLDPAGAVDYLTTAVEEEAALPAKDPGRLAPADAERLLDLRPTLAGWADTLLATGLPLTLEHSDLHPNNAFWAPPGEPLRIFDFGDAVVGFPLCSLTVPVQMMSAAGAGMPGLDPPDVDRVLDGYLEMFSDLVPVRELRRVLPAALQVGRLHRHESWRRVLRSADDAGYAAFGDAPAAWLAMLGT